MDKKIKIPNKKEKVKEKSIKMPDIKEKVKEKSIKMSDIKEKIKDKSANMPDIKGKISGGIAQIKENNKEKKENEVKKIKKPKEEEKNNPVLYKNELEANVVIAKVLIACIIGVLAVLFLNIIGIFIVDMGVMLVGTLVSVAALLVPIIVVRVLKKEGVWVKYVIIGACIVVITCLTCTLSYHTVAFFIFPVIVSTIYCSKKVNYITMVATIIATTIGQILGFVLNTFPDKNVGDIKGLVIYFILPRTMIIIALSIILTGICERIATILGRFIDATEEKVLLERSAQMTKQSLEVSKDLYDSVNKLSETSYTVTKISQRIVDETEQVVQVTAESKENMNEVSKGVNEIDDQLIGLNDKCEKVSKAATDIRTIAHENTKKIKRASDSMRLINDSNDECIKVIKLLEEQADKIMDITKAIADISGQTNMLSLNASIEAARAGEHGKGFFVVAEEIQQLSVETKKAVDDIANIMDVIKDSTEDAIDAMERSYKITQVGLEHMNEVREDAEQIQNSNIEMSENVVDISGITRNIKRHSKQIMGYCEDISKLIDRNFDSIQKVSAVTQESSASAEVLQEMVYSIKNVAKKLSDVAQA